MKSSQLIEPLKSSQIIEPIKSSLCYLSVAANYRLEELLKTVPSRLYGLSRVLVASLTLAGFGGAAIASPNRSLQFTPSDVTGPSRVEDSSDLSLMDNAEMFAADKKWSQSLTNWDKLLKKYPGCPAFAVRRALVLRDSGFRKPAEHAFEKLVHDVAAKGDLYYSPYYYLAQTYAGNGEKAKCEATCFELLKKFPQRADVASGVLEINRLLGSPRVASAAKERLQFLQSHPPKYDTTLSTMSLPGRAALPAGIAYEMMVSTDCFPRFKLIMTSDRVTGDTGVAKYFIGPPDYEKVTLVNDESQNYFKTTIADLMLDHCSRKVQTPHLGKVTKVGDKNILGIDCVELKCQDFEESSYANVLYAKNIVVSKQLARTINLLCGAPVADLVPLGATTVKQGYPLKNVTVTSIRKIKVTPQMMTLNPKFHAVHSKGELIYASNGALKDSDLDQYLQSK